MLVIQRRMLIGPHVLRSLEHQVLEQVREARAAGLLVLRSDVIPDRQVHDRRRVILEEDDLQPVRRAWSSCSRTWWAGRSCRRAARRTAARTAAGDGQRANDELPANHRRDYVTSAAASSAARRASRSATVLRSSGSRRTSTTASRHSATSPAGMPATCWPASTSFVTADLAPTTRAAAEVDVAGRARLPRHDHVVVEHGAAGDADLRGQQHVAADLARRGRSARGCRSSCPAPMRVSPIAGRSIAECAPISTSSSITTRPTCGNLLVRAVGRRANPKPSLPMTAASCTTTRSPMHDVFANRHVRVDDAVRANRRAAADRRRAGGRRCARRCARAAPIDDERRDRDVGAELGRRIDAASGLMPGAGGAGGVSSATASANARYGWRVRRIAHGARVDACRRR